jgi:hypothetical protein
MRLQRAGAVPSGPNERAVPCDRCGKLLGPVHSAAELQQDLKAAAVLYAVFPLDLIP